MPTKFNKYKKNTYKSPKAKKSDLEGNELSWGSFRDFFRNRRLKKTFGFFLIIVSIYMLMAFSSYMVSWKADDAVLDSREFNWELLTNKEIVVENMMGRLGAITAHLFINKWFGISSFLFIFVFSLLGVKFLLNYKLLPIRKSLGYSAFFLIWISVFFGYLIGSGEWLILGGVFGFQMSLWLNGLIGKLGTALLLFFSLGSFTILVFDPNFSHVAALTSRLFSGKLFGQTREDEFSQDEEESADSQEFAGEQENSMQDPGDMEEDDPRSESEIIAALKEENKKDFGNDGAVEQELEVEQGQQENKAEDADKDPEWEIEVGKESNQVSGSNYQSVEDPFGKPDNDVPDLSHLGEYDPTLDLPHYKIPGTELLDERGSNTIQVNKEELEANKNRIIETLNNYSIQIDRIKATVGPTVTLYEIIPAPGVRISKIKNLENDIALSLSALGIRIIAPIPGRGTIGIEVPNSNPEIVSMRSILESDKFQNSSFELPIGLGKTIANETFITDLTKMPHLLMAGATGQGKSVGLNAVLASILYKKHPAYVKFVLVDPKKVELTLFSKIERHFLAKLPDAEEAIVTETRQVVRTLNSLCIEMDNRYDLLKDAQVRNIKEYNAKFKARRLNPEHGHRFLPYIILFIDEFADLIMTAGKEIEMPIARLAQLSRAVGLHLIIATQRPSVNIITGTIKANFPARIAFRVTSRIDSRTILDTGGADQLIGRGDMLLSTGSDLIRLQCAFIDTPEIDRITDFIGSQRAYPDALHLPEYFDEESSGAESLDPSERDELFEDAARIVVSTQQGSTSLLQRKLKLGYNRAGRIIDQLEAAGIVGAFEGSKARDVKIKDEVALEQILRQES